MTAPHIEPFFMDVGRGRRFCILHRPPAGQLIRGGLLYVHPFAEEMNCARRLVALQAQRFASAGYAVLQMDLDGCGDSTGDFSDATWTGWVNDVVMAAQWLRSRVSGALWLWGVRAGCLLASEAATRLDSGSVCYLFWQPVVLGQQYLNQFLRLKLLAEMARGRPSQQGQSPADALKRGESVEVAGYTVSPDLASGLAAADLKSAAVPVRAICFEINAQAGTSLSPALTGVLERWRGEKADVTSAVLPGAAFWLQLGCELPSALSQSSLAALESITAMDASHG